jgi:hypothetical protein
MFLFLFFRDVGVKVFPILFIFSTRHFFIVVTNLICFFFFKIILNILMIYFLFILNNFIFYINLNIYTIAWSHILKYLLSSHFTYKILCLLLTLIILFNILCLRLCVLLSFHFRNILILGLTSLSSKVSDQVTKLR